MSENELSLKVLEAYTRDVGRGVARIDYDSMDHLSASTGDVIEIDTDKGFLKVHLTSKELAQRRKKWKPKKIEYTSGTLWKYSQSVGPAFKGAVTHPGASKEKKCYADI